MGIANVAWFTLFQAWTNGHGGTDTSLVNVRANAEVLLGMDGGLLTASIAERFGGFVVLVLFILQLFTFREHCLDGCWQVVCQGG